MKKRTPRKSSQNPWGLFFALFMLISLAILLTIDSKNMIISKILGIKSSEYTPKEFQIPISTNIATPEISPTPTLTPTPSEVNKNQINTQSQKYIPTNTIPEEELINAINIYRQSHGLSSLNKNESLCQETRKRVQDMILLNAGKPLNQITLNHDGMETDLNNGVLARLVGKSRYGENIAYAGCKRPADGVIVDVATGIQLVEWCFDSSPGHRANLLEPYWTDVCSSGQFPYYVETFAE